MARTILSAVLAATIAAGSGCAKWQSPQSTEYVTVGADTQHNTDEARKEYLSARKAMQKYIAGEKYDFAHMEKKLKDSLAADVRFGPAHHSLGVVYFWQKRLYLAAWEFEYSSRLMADRYEPLNNLGLVYESAGKFEQARTFYCLAREKSPHHSEIIANLARASFRSGIKVNEMRPLLEDVVATNPNPAWRRWAAELLGVNPPPDGIVSPEAIESFLSNPPNEPSSIDRTTNSSDEELPLIAPPPPDAEPAPIAEPFPLLDDSGGAPQFDVDLPR